MYGAFSANLNNPIFEEDDFHKLLLMIRGALANNSQDMAVDYFLVLNEMLMERGEYPLSITTILFLNFDLFIPEINPPLSHVYIVEFSDGLVKVGISQNPSSRLRTLETQRGLLITRKKISTATLNASRIEHSLHKTFRDYRLEGEYFNCDYEEIVKNAVEHFRDFTNLNTPLVGVM